MAPFHHALIVASTVLNTAVVVAAIECPIITLLPFTARS